MINDLHKLIYELIEQEHVDSTEAKNNPKYDLFDQNMILYGASQRKFTLLNILKWLEKKDASLKSHYINIDSAIKSETEYSGECVDKIVKYVSKLEGKCTKKEKTF